jgi:ABC-type Fe3+ transport system permease subunit
MSYGTPPPTDGPYGQQPHYGGQPAPTHGSATTALVLGILSLVVCAPLGIPAYIIGRRAEREVRESGGRLSGEGLAKAGWILGLIGMILMALGIVVLILVVSIATVSSNGSV